MDENRRPAPEDDIDPIERILDQAEEALRPPDIKYLAKIDKLENWVAFLVYIIIVLVLVLCSLVHQCKQEGCL